MNKFTSVVGRFGIPAILLAFALPANALTYQGTTSGSFSDATTANFISFTGANFGPGITSGGSATLANLGVFTITLPGSNPAITATGIFSLDVTFTAPAGANTVNPIVATVAGTINKNNANNVVLDFGPGQTVNFSSPEGSGSFFFAINDLIFPNGSGNGAQRTLTGSISSAVFSETGPLSTTSPVPEPGSLALLGFGLAGLGLIRRRRAN